jgi:hypothetical protein
VGGNDALWQIAYVGLFDTVNGAVFKEWTSDDAYAGSPPCGAQALSGGLGDKRRDRPINRIV